LLEPIDIHAVLSGTGKNYGIIEYTKEEYNEELNDREIVVYTSGYGGLFRSGLAVGKIIKDKETKKNIVNFFSDFRQLDYVKIVSYEIGSGN
jgi:rod shape-determining protein MreC